LIQEGFSCWVRSQVEETKECEPPLGNISLYQREPICILPSAIHQRPQAEMSGIGVYQYPVKDNRVVRGWILGWWFTVTKRRNIRSGCLPQLLFFWDH
jgi:hypothetical protein